MEAAGGEAKYTSGTVHRLTAESTPIEREFYDFYRTRRGEYTPPGQSPRLTTHPTLSSNVKFMNFYPFNDVETISPRPMLFITGDRAHSREFSADAYRRAAEPKQLAVVPGAGHVDLYDRVNLIPFDKLTAFFTQHLAARGRPPSPAPPRADEERHMPNRMLKAAAITLPLVTAGAGRVQWWGGPGRATSCGSRPGRSTGTARRRRRR